MRDAIDAGATTIAGAGPNAIDAANANARLCGAFVEIAENSGRNVQRNRILAFSGCHFHVQLNLYGVNWEHI